MNLCLRTIGACLLGATIAAGAACGPTTTHVYVATRPPAPVYEVRAASPGPGYVWVEGYHHWDGRAYAWTPGRWEREPYARATWAPGQWQHDRHGWYYVEGHWVKH
jgi:hypothetical protein